MHFVISHLEDAQLIVLGILIDSDIGCSTDFIDMQTQKQNKKLPLVKRSVSYVAHESFNKN